MAITGFATVPQILLEVTATPGAITTATTKEISLTVPQSTPEMTFVVTPEISLQSSYAGAFISHAYCVTAGTVVLVLGNLTNGTITLPALTFHVLGL